MKKINQLCIIEAGNEALPLFPEFQSLLTPFSEAPVAIHSFNYLPDSSLDSFPELVLFHTDLTTIAHLRNYIHLQTHFPHSSVVIVSNRQDEELCLLALEAGADDSIVKRNLTAAYLRKQVLHSLRRLRTEKELSRSQVQLLACIQNTPNVGVQWYTSKGEVLFWNTASERIFGRTAEEAIGKQIDQLIHIPEDQHFWLDKIRQIATTEDSGVSREWHYHRRDGSEGYCLSTLFPIPSFNSDPWIVCMDVDITNLKQTQKKLQQSEERYHTLFNQASDAIFINDTKGRYLDVNQKACELTGYTKDQLLQMSVYDVYTPQELERRPIMWDELLRGERTSVERNMTLANGTLLPIEVTAQMLTDGRIMAIVRDISERKRAEQELQKSEKKYRTLIEHMGDAITIFDRQGRIVEVNSSATELLHYSAEELQHMSIFDLLPEQDMQADPVVFETLDSGISTMKQRRIRRRDGTLVKAEVYTKKVDDNMYLASARDLTERIEVQQRIEKEKELSDTIINSLPGLFYLYQPGVGYLRWNEQLEKTMGYTAAEIRQMTPLDFFDESEREKIEQEIQKVFAKGSNAIEANMLTRDRKKIPFYITGRAIHYGSKPSFLGTAIDISEIRKLKQKLSRQKIAEQKRVMQAMIEAEEKEKNKLGFELHDNVNQILSVVCMYLTILNSDQQMEGVTLSKAIGLLNSAIEEIRHLSHSLAVGYKFETGLTGALEDSVEKIRLAKHFPVSLSMPSSLDEVTNSQQKLAIYRIVQEQLNNVIKHAQATCVNVVVEVDDDRIRLQVTDNGIGFNPLKAKKGLGLNNITTRAEALEGNVSIHSKPGQGCRLEVTIPLQPTEANEEDYVKAE